MKNTNKQSLDAPFYDRKTRFVRVVARRFRELSEIVELIQVLADRPQTYLATENNAQEFLEAWRNQLNILESYYSVEREDSPASLKSSFEFTDAPINEKNLRFIRVANKRLTRLMRLLAKFGNNASGNYVSSVDERKALIDALNMQYQTTRALFLPSALTNDLYQSLENPEFVVCGLNVNGKAGKMPSRQASLTKDVLPALAGFKEAPDILALNELHKGENFEVFKNKLESAGYRVLCDPRSPKNRYNEVLLAFGPRIISLREKLVCYHPEVSTGLDFLATVLPLWTGKRLAVVSIRLHSAMLNEDYQVHKQNGNLQAASYQNMSDVALPQLKKLIVKLKGESDDILLIGDHNHARVVPTGDYQGLDQAPVSEQVQRELLKKYGVIMYTPSGGSVKYKNCLIPDDHISASSGVKVTDLAYKWTNNVKLDHAAVMAKVSFPPNADFKATEKIIDNIK